MADNDDNGIGLPGTEGANRKSFFRALNEYQEYTGFSEDWEDALIGE